MRVRSGQAVLVAVIAMISFFTPRVMSAQDDDGPKLAQQVRSILERNCYRCHGQNGANEGGFDFILDFTKLVGKKVIAGDPGKSRLFKRVGVIRDMPPEGEEPRPSDAEIAVIEKWIKAGAPAPVVEAQKPRPFVSLADELAAIQKYLRKAGRDDRAYIRFFTLRHLHNLSPEKVRDADLQIYRAALAKLINSLSWKKEVVVPVPADPAGTVLAVDIRKLDWDRHELWRHVLRAYPYGLKHDQYPDDTAVRDLAEEVYSLAGTEVPAVRADWFIATAARPPLYHALLQLPETDMELERVLGVHVTKNFLDAKVKRAGFNASGVSGHNRLVERHDASFGAYWKSYDFKTSTGRGNLFVYPLGPTFEGNSFARQAFTHAGGEIIFNLPNGLQGYLLVDDTGKRIDAGPVEIVNDSSKVSGTPLVVNGLSCMNCHQHGMIPFKDQVRTGHILGGQPRDFVRRIFPEPDEMDRVVQRDRQRFLTALEEAMGRFLQVGPDAKRPIEDFKEPISAIARWYLNQELTLDEAARELGIDEPKRLAGSIEANTRLQELGLYPLSRGHTIKREVWEDTQFLVSPFQDAARELKLGTPKTNR